ncbi:MULTISPECIES: c-type cytochrome [unclassified Paracoccus (in: a-proteobacteria)]|uniref:c-type cytochrome n=1 Tax=unclassified Paracoccus (in: a-proteobacteria) TaxID=2688777 RepID=UPI0012B1CC0F|nr:MULTISPECIES: cytochrome c [unclassified Paracoccus (in: a-proteobacteria)]UXU76522.1 cytochrome c [Paracoccus sp. SMMA_5]UXU82411.1 cytochrome c [Paracoccus sp. SMMA_5_TC]
MMRALIATSILAGLLAGPASAQDATLDPAAQFEAHCAMCHNTAGTGTAGLAPALDRPEFWQALGDNAGKYAAGVAAKGLNMAITVRGESFRGMIMPPPAGIPDDQLAAAATYVVATLGQTDHVVTADDIAAARQGVSNDDLKAMRPPSE